MIANPPAAVAILRNYRELHVAYPEHAVHRLLATLLRIHAAAEVAAGWPRFLGWWHLHLQAIPLATARDAWGLASLQLKPVP